MCSQNTEHADNTVSPNAEKPHCSICMVNYMLLAFVENF
jgi:hypothetical protein